MFCDHPVANLLTAQLRAFPIRHIVVCPGSRNAILTVAWLTFAVRAIS